MSTAKTAIAVLTEAETKLRELVGQAAAGSEYDVAAKIASAAKNVAAIASAFKWDGSVREPDALTKPGFQGADGTKRPLEAPERAGRRRGSKRAGRTGRAARKRAYPRFYRDGDYLVKVAWSKKERREYQHKAPRRVADLLAAEIEKRSRNGRLFTSEEIFPLQDPQSAGDVPSYQAYAALAWFRQLGLVRPHGRRGYTVKKDGRLPEPLTAAWQSLAESPN
jgi:hypothetical protein